MTARIRCAGRDHAGRILNVSEGGFLLAPFEDFTPTIGGTVEVETAQLGAIQAHVIAVSGQGLHLKISHASDAHEHAVRRLAGLIRPWTDRSASGVPEREAVSASHQDSAIKKVSADFSVRRESMERL